MKMKTLCCVLTASMILSLCAGCGTETNDDTTPTTETVVTESTTQETETVYGRITEIGTDAITISQLAEMVSPQGGEMPGGEAPSGEAPEKPSGEAPSGEAPSGMPSGEAPSGEAPSGEAPNGEAPSGMPGGEAPSGEAPEKPDGEAPSGEAPSGMPNGETPSGMPGGEAPSGEAPSGMPGGEAPNGEAPSGAPGSQENLPENLEGETCTYTLTDETVYTVNGETASLADLQVGDMVVIEIDGSEAKTITVQSMTGGPDGMPGGMGGSTSVDTEGAYQVTDTQAWNGDSYDTQDADMSVIMVTDGGSLTLENATVEKSGDTSNTENSEFYGQNAAVLVKSGSSATISDTTISTSAEGANAVFATGEGAEITLSGVTINTTGNSSRGLDATYGGSITTDTVDITTQGAHCAALATDRGEGTITVTNGKLRTSGEGSPCIYSTGNITVSDSEGLATGSSIAVVEGKNSITVKNSTLKAYGIGRANGGIDDAGVMIYQSMSGDAGEGTGSFTAEDSTLSISEESGKYTTAPMFFVTNTDAVIRLTNTELQYGSGVLLSATGNDGEWGNAGSNGGNVEFYAENQSLAGDVEADEISTISMVLTNSELKGAVNAENTAKEVALSLDSDSIWEVTGTSYVTVLTNGDITCGNIHSNGYDVYYDADAAGNEWLNGATVTLAGGGSLLPM